MSLHQPLSLKRGPAWPNHFALAPMTNCQSHSDGTLSDDELHWLAMRAQGGFGLTMTCASHVQAIGQGFPGQLGCWDDRHIPGLTRVADAIRAAGSVSSIQLHHAGYRSPRELIGGPAVAPSDDAESGAVGLTLDGVHELRESFIAAAIRAEKAGFDGVQLHGAHSYILCAFLSPETNRREDEYGDRARLLWEILRGIREQCRPDFQVGVRLSPDGYGLIPGEMLSLAEELMTSGLIDHLDISLWDWKKLDESGQRVLDLYSALDRGETRLGAAGKILSGIDAQACLDAGLDFVSIGRSAILHHDWPRILAQNPAAEPRELPVHAETLRQEGLGEAFIAYMRRWKGFVAD